MNRNLPKFLKLIKQESMIRKPANKYEESDDQSGKISKFLIKKIYNSYY